MQHVFKKALSLRLLNFIITNINGKKIVSNELRLVSEVMRVQIFVFSFFYVNLPCHIRDIGRHLFSY